MEHARPREVRLLPEYAHLYPGLPAGEWVPANSWAAELVSRARAARARGSSQRTFDSRHFEFRGGPEPQSHRDQHLRARAEDR
jgi:hypothetical protein